MDGIAKSPSAVTVTTSTYQDLQVLTPTKVTEAIAFAMNVKKETADESASVRKRSADTLDDHDYCIPPTPAETDKPAPKIKKPKLNVLIPLSAFVQKSTQSRSASMRVNRNKSLSRRHPAL